MNKILRDQEVKLLKSELKRMLGEMGISKRVFKKTLPKMNGEGYKYGISALGGSPSIRQQYSFFKGLYEFKMKELREAAEAKEKKENENGKTK